MELPNELWLADIYIRRFPQVVQRTKTARSLGGQPPISRVLKRMCLGRAPPAA
jgi:hypothetical protein